MGKVTRIEKALKNMLGLPEETSCEAVQTALSAGDHLFRVHPATVSPHAVFKKAGVRINARSLTELGDAWLEMGLYARAVDAYDQAIKRDANHYHAHFNCGMARAALGEYDAAADDFGRAAGIDPESPSACANAAAALAKANRFQEALEFAQRAVHLDGRNVASLVNLGAILTHMGVPEAGLDVLDTAIDFAPKLARAHYDRACALTRLGRTGKAKRALRKAQELDPSMAERVQGDEELAILNFQKSDAPDAEPTTDA